MPKVEIARSFSFKLNLGGYQTADFFCSQKSEVPEEEAEKKSEELYKFCQKEVFKNLKEYIEKYKEKDVKELYDALVDVGSEEIPIIEG